MENLGGNVCPKSLRNSVTVNKSSCLGFWLNDPKSTLIIFFQYLVPLHGGAFWGSVPDMHDVMAIFPLRSVIPLPEKCPEGK